MNNPYILDETDDFAVVFKPPKMHCTHAGKSIKESGENGGTLYEWYLRQNISQTAEISQLKQREASIKIMHRLDFETNGLVLFAKNEYSYNLFKSAQDNGAFIKEYSAVCSHNAVFSLPGFPPFTPAVEQMISGGSLNKNLPVVIESFFRPFGPGRKFVRPVIDDNKKHKEIAKDKGGFYKTEIIGINNNIFTVKIKRGFRHQIRCHLCWIGFPIINDPLYRQSASEDEKQPVKKDFLALRSHALFFPDPSGGKQREYRIDALAEDYSRLTAL